MYDDLGAGIGSTIAFSEGGEAAQPFRPNEKPVDAYNAAILDHIDIESTLSSIDEQSPLSQLTSRQAND